jgi:hypothetical protein
MSCGKWISVLRERRDDATGNSQCTICFDLVVSPRIIHIHSIVRIFIACNHVNLVKTNGT